LFGSSIARIAAAATAILLSKTILLSPHGGDEMIEGTKSPSKIKMQVMAPTPLRMTERSNKNETVFDLATILAVPLDLYIFGLIATDRSIHIERFQDEQTTPCIFGLICIEQAIHISKQDLPIFFGCHPTTKLPNLQNHHDESR